MAPSAPKYGPSGSSGAKAAPTPDAAPDTRTRLLDAAEDLFAAGGIAATSLRQITAAAHANLAAVNYHFGSRHGLIAEVFARRLGPLNDERLRRLAEAETRAGEGDVSVEEILDALLVPAFRLLESGVTGPGLVRLLGRAHSEPSADVRAIVFSQFGAVFERFQRALGRALPHLSADEVTSRMKYAIGAMAFVMAGVPVLPGLTEPRPPRSERDRLVAFLAAGLRAPAASISPGGAP